MFYTHKQNILIFSSPKEHITTTFL